MKVLFVVDTFPNFSETFIRDQIMQLIDNGLDVRIICYNGFDEDESLALKDTLDYNFRERTISFKSFLEQSKLKRIFFVLKKLTMVLRKPYFKVLVRSLDKSKYGKLSKNLGLFYLVNYIMTHTIEIVHAHYGPNGNQMSLLKQIGVPIKLITTFHGYDVRMGYNNGNDFYNSLKKYGDTFISISEYNKSSLLEFGFEKEKIIDLPNGVDTSFFHKEYGYGISEQKKIRIITVARLVPEKNIALAINAFSQVILSFPHLTFQYHIVGDGLEREKLQKLVKNLNVEKFVCFHGAKTTKEVRDLMIKSDIFVLSSSVEAFPTVILEAKSCGLPILATDVGSVRSMINNCGIVVQPNSDQELTSGLKTLIQKREDWKIMAEIGRKQIVENYDVKKLSLKLISVYEE